MSRFSSKKQRRSAMVITEGELVAMTRDMEEMHAATLPALRQSVTNMIGSLNQLQPSRRTFLMGSSAAAGAVLLAACGSSTTTLRKSTSTTASTAAAGPLTGDVQIAAMAASLENLGVATYKAGIDAATSGKLGAVPPSIVTFAQTAMKQHQDHADAWNAVVTSTGHAKITEVDQALKPTVDQMFAQVKDVPGLGKLALAIEDIAAATYLNGLGVMQNRDAVKTAASIQPVEMQHAAILHFVLGEYPVPDTFAKTDGARPPGDFTG